MAATDAQEETLHRYLDKRLSGVHPRRTTFHADFFARFSADEIPKILDEWKLVEKVRASAGVKMVINADGLWRDDGTRW